MAGNRQVPRPMFTVDEKVPSRLAMMRQVDILAQREPLMREPAQALNDQWLNRAVANMDNLGQDFFTATHRLGKADGLFDVDASSASSFPYYSGSRQQADPLGTHDGVALSVQTLYNVSESSSKFHFHYTTNGFDPKGFLIITPKGRACMACQPTRKHLRCGANHHANEACDVTRCDACKTGPEMCKRCQDRQKNRVECSEHAKNVRRCGRCYQGPHACSQCESTNKNNDDINAYVREICEVANRPTRNGPCLCPLCTRKHMFEEETVLEAFRKKPS